MSKDTSLKTKRIDWDAHLDRWQAMGISQTAYCRQYTLSLSQFSYWKCKRLGRSSPTAKAAPSHSGFVPVQLADTTEPTSSTTLSLTLPNGYRIDGIAQDTLGIAQHLVKAVSV